MIILPSYVLYLGSFPISLRQTMLKTYSAYINIMAILDFKKITLFLSDSSSTDPETIKNISCAISPDLYKNSSGAN